MAAIAVAARVREVRDMRGPRGARDSIAASPSYAEFPGERGPMDARAAAAEAAGVASAIAVILAAIIVNVAGYFGGGLLRDDLGTLRGGSGRRRGARSVGPSRCSG